MLNWALLKHPLNWVIVTLMVILGVFLLNVILTPFHLPQKGTFGLSPNSNLGTWPYLAATQ